MLIFNLNKEKKKKKIVKKNPQYPLVSVFYCYINAPVVE